MRYIGFKDKGDREVAFKIRFYRWSNKLCCITKKSEAYQQNFHHLVVFGDMMNHKKVDIRFFHQWNIETFGNLNTEHDAETIEFTSRFFDNLKLQNISIDINHRKLVESYINQIFESNETTLHDIFRAVDKTQKNRKMKYCKNTNKKAIHPEKLEKIIQSFLKS